MRHGGRNTHVQYTEARTYGKEGSLNSGSSLWRRSSRGLGPRTDGRWPSSCWQVPRWSQEVLGPWRKYCNGYVHWLMYHRDVRCSRCCICKGSRWIPAGSLCRAVSSTGGMAPKHVCHDGVFVRGARCALCGSWARAATVWSGARSLRLQRADTGACASQQLGARAGDCVSRRAASTVAVRALWVCETSSSMQDSKQIMTFQAIKRGSRSRKEHAGKKRGSRRLELQPAPPLDLEPRASSHSRVRDEVAFEASARHVRGSGRMRLARGRVRRATRGEAWAEDGAWGGDVVHDHVALDLTAVERTSGDRRRPPPAHCLCVCVRQRGIPSLTERQRVDVIADEGRRQGPIQTPSLEEFADSLRGTAGWCV